MSTQQTTEQERWNKLLDDAFGSEQPSEPAEEPAALEEIPVEEPTTCPEPPAPDMPALRNRRLWPVLIAAAALLIVLTGIFLLLRPEAEIPELLMCKDALAQWQSHESYHITEESERFVSMALRPFKVEHFRHGEDIIQLTDSFFNPSLSSSMLYTMQGLMRKDGQYYELIPNTSDDMTTPDVVVLQWKPTLFYVENFNYPWPITFQWDDEKILSHNTLYYESGAVDSVMITVKEDRTNRDNSPYNVVFRFAETGELTAVSVQEIATNNHNFTGIYISTFRLQDTDPEQIKNRFIIPTTTSSYS